MAWILYVDDNGDKVVGANTGATGAWVRWVDSTFVESDRINGVKLGNLYRYCPEVRLYKCPTGLRGELVTYSIVDAMNGYADMRGTRNPMVYRRMQIERPNERLVFPDEGRLSPNRWTIWYDEERWLDRVTARLGDGTDVGFADGHSEYWTWKNPRTLEVAKAEYGWWLSAGGQGDMFRSPGDEDLDRVQRGVCSVTSQAADNLGLPRPLTYQCRPCTFEFTMHY